MLNYVYIIKLASACKQRHRLAEVFSILEFSWVDNPEFPVITDVLQLTLLLPQLSSIIMQT